VLYSRQLGLYEQYVPPLLHLYERYCPGFCARLALTYQGRDLHGSSTEIWWDKPSILAPIAHPQQYHDLEDLTEIFIPEIMLESGVHPLLASILAPRVPQIHMETALSCLRYLQFGGHSVKSRKSLKSILKSRYFTRLKMRPSLARFRKRRHHHSSWRYLLEKRDFHSMWWGDYRKRPSEWVFLMFSRDFKHSIRVPPLHFFSYQSEYASNYDLWYTYQSALQLLPLVLVNAPHDSHLASIATNCTFNTFCTAYPRETRKAKKSITRYLSRCRPIRAIRERAVVDVMSGMNVD